jgi:hypothetical protein
MHAVLTEVTVADREAAEKILKERVVPGASAAPGFVTGYWMSMPPSKGRGVIVFESEEAAEAFAGQFQPPPDAPVTLESVAVGEVVAHA